MWKSGEKSRRHYIAASIVVALCALVGALSPAYALRCDAPILTLTATAVPTLQVGQLYSQSNVASGGTPTYTFSYTGTLPAGTSMDSNGFVSGVLTTPGPFSYTVTVNDSCEQSASAASSGVILPGGGRSGGGGSSLSSGQGANLDPTTSGASTSDAVANAISNAFAPTGQSFAMNENGFRLALGPEDSTDNAASGAFARAEQRWSAWGDLRLTGWTVNPAPVVAGHQTNAIGGVSYRPDPSVVLGGLGGYEAFSYGFNAGGGRLRGTGWSFGGYLGWRPDNGMRFDASITRSSINYVGMLGAATSNFTANRWIGSAGVAGATTRGAWTFEPSARIFGVWETQAAFTDSLGVAQPVNSFSLGRASAGGKLTFENPLGASGTWSTYVGGFGDYRFSHGGNGPFTGTGRLIDGWSLRTTAGLAVRGASGGTFGLAAELAGIAANHRDWSLRATAGLPF